MISTLFNYLIRVIVFYTDTFMSSHSLFLRGRWDSSFFPWKAPGLVKVLRKVSRSWKKKAQDLLKFPERIWAPELGWDCYIGNITKQQKAAIGDSKSFQVNPQPKSLDNLGK